MFFQEVNVGTHGKYINSFFKTLSSKLRNNHRYHYSQPVWIFAVTDCILCPVSESDWDSNRVEASFQFFILFKTSLRKPKMLPYTQKNEVSGLWMKADHLTDYKTPLITFKSGSTVTFVNPQWSLSRILLLGKSVLLRFRILFLFLSKLMPWEFPSCLSLDIFSSILIFISIILSSII